MKISKKYIERIILNAARRIEALTKGKIKVLDSKKRVFRMFNQKTKKWAYVKKEENKTLQEIAQRNYEEKVLAESKKQLKYISYAEKVNPRYLIDIANKINPARLCLIKLYEIPDKDYIEQWLSKEFHGNPYPDEKHYTTQNGEKVRSKSEVIIANYLKSKNIPYRYEYPLKLSNRVVYPDFLILNVHTRQEIILEHFGMLDKSDYLENGFIKKLNLYIDNGYRLGVDFIFTYETEKSQLNINLLEEQLGAVLE